MIFGANGNIGIAVSEKLKNEYLILKIGKDKIDFSDKHSPDKIQTILLNEKPDLIINCSGVLGSNIDQYENVFDINFKPNWEIIKFYLNNPPKKITKFIMIGSSSYKSGRKNYMLYSASKAALNNLFEGAKENLENTNIIIGIINPVKVKSDMIKNFHNSNKFLTIEETAKQIYMFINKLNKSKSKDMDYKK